ncbi:DUF1798 family protein [Staphylococcus canis]|uniref:DUF1798 family protein n=1 Tax=Staphylococcus canis TaxID=2724942 RepID=A0ABS0T9I0_9STAP|nr:DUF1798 family protein [Staphylococcus canis]MBI5975376.1 DUF1798 family protein [Staphylococcus canis]
MSLSHITTRLQQDLQLIYERFQKAREGYHFDFNHEIKPFVEDIDNHLEIFLKYETSVVQHPYFNHLQYQKLIELIKEISLSCHHPKTSLKIFMEQYKTIQHLLKLLLEMED